jgi:hypothetical protein
MRSKRWALAVVGALAFAPALAACSESEPDDDDARDVSSSEPIDRSPTDDASEPAATTSEAPAAGLPAACDILEPIDIATAYGATPGAGEVGGGGYSEQGVEWQTDNCDFEAENFFEVELAIAGPDDFPAGFTCPPQTEIVATVEKVKVPGADSASWKVSEGDDFEGELRVCTDDAVFDISLDFEDGYQHEGDPRAQTIALAEVVLERLG